MDPTTLALIRAALALADRVAKEGTHTLGAELATGSLMLAVDKYRAAHPEAERDGDG